MCSTINYPTNRGPLPTNSPGLRASTFWIGARAGSGPFERATMLADIAAADANEKVRREATFALSRRKRT